MQNLKDLSGLGTNMGGLLQGLVDSSTTPRVNMDCTSCSSTSFIANRVGCKGTLTTRPGDMVLHPLHHPGGGGEENIPVTLTYLLDLA